MRRILLLCVLTVILVPIGFVLTDRGAAVEPDLSVYASLTPSTVDPDDIVSLTVIVDNPGPETAPLVQLNATFPAATGYVSDDAETGAMSPFFAGRWFPPGEVRFNFTDVSPGNRTVAVLARVGPGVGDGQILASTVTRFYTNATGASQPLQERTASTTVSIPVITVEKVASSLTATTLTYTVWVNNTGSAAAAKLWLNDSLPGGTTFSRIRRLPGGPSWTCTSSDPAWANCTWSGFGPQTRSFDIEANLQAGLPPGTVLTNGITLEYTDDDRTPIGFGSDTEMIEIPAASIRVSKVADSEAVLPGSTATFRIFYNNTGSLTARTVWVNDTLPIGELAFVSSTPNPGFQSATLIQWNFQNVGPGVHEIVLTTTVSSALENGTGVTNQVTVNYTDPTGVEKPGSRANATVVVVQNLPQIVVVKAGSASTVVPGGTVTYTIWYNNTRSAIAQTVAIEDSLPPGVTIASAAPFYDARTGNRVRWNMSGVPMGPHAITLEVILDTSVPEGTTLVNWAFLNYTDSFGNRLSSSASSARFEIRSPGLPIPAIAAAVIAAAVLLLAARVVAVRRGGTVIDDVFLLHRDGLLIKHYTRRLRPDVDSDVLSGMLIAVQNFINESFIGEVGLGKEGALDEMRFGNYRILIMRGRFVVVAAVVTGRRADAVSGKIRNIIEDMEGELGPVLEGWEGDMEEVAAADAYMQDLLSGRNRGGFLRRTGNKT